ncbi:MAG: hypothetical protein LBI49_07760 [Nocardiopsaceae bacterium]|nr:hypothetical protein [Nocardiopsaceae bacterium]
MIVPAVDASAYVGDHLLKARAWRATSQERRMTLPGDELVPDPMVQSTRAVTISAPPQRVWPWLVQTGQARADSYLDSPFWERSAEWNYRRLSARQSGKQAAGDRVSVPDRLISSGQDARAGDIIADGPAGMAYYVVQQAEPYRSLVVFTDTHLRQLLPARLRDNPRFNPSGQLSDSCWLTEPVPGTTRLVRRTRLRCRPWLFRVYVVALAWGEVITARTPLRAVRQQAESTHTG